MSRVLYTRLRQAGFFTIAADMFRIGPSGLCVSLFFLCDDGSRSWQQVRHSQQERTKVGSMRMMNVKSQDVA